MDNFQTFELTYAETKYTVFSASDAQHWADAVALYVQPAAANLRKVVAGLQIEDSDVIPRICVCIGDKVLVAKLGQLLPEAAELLRTAFTSYTFVSPDILEHISILSSYDFFLSNWKDLTSYTLPDGESVVEDVLRLLVLGEDLLQYLAIRTIIVKNIGEMWLSPHWF